MNKKIKKQAIAFKNIKTKQVRSEYISFSFRYFDHHKFGYSDEDNYLSSFLERLCAISHMTIKELINARSNAIRFHAVDWSSTKMTSGFSHLTDELQSETAWQFSISSNKHGRVFGFIVDTVFYIVWLDYEHLVYS